MNYLIPVAALVLGFGSVLCLLSIQARAECKRGLGYYDTLAADARRHANQQKARLS